MGSPSGLWTAVSGGMAQSHNVDTIANNIANINTTGFKKDAAVFKEYLTAYENPEAADPQIPQTIYKDSDFYHHHGKEHAMVQAQKNHTDFSQGILQPTNKPFDFAIDGKGLFLIQTSEGKTQFTRNGHFKVTADGFLVTNEGSRVLGTTGGIEGQKFSATGDVPKNESGEALATPVNLNDALASGKKVYVKPGGDIYAGNALIAKVIVAEFDNTKDLRKKTDSLIENTNPANTWQVSKESKVLQGFLEGSNVNPIEEMVNLLRANRNFEANMKAIRAYNDMAGKEANEVGKL